MCYGLGGAWYRELTRRPPQARDGIWVIWQREERRRQIHVKLNERIDGTDMPSGTRWYRTPAWTQWTGLHGRYPIDFHSQTKKSMKSGLRGFLHSQRI